MMILKYKGIKDAGNLVPLMVIILNMEVRR